MSSETREVLHDQHAHPTAKKYIMIGVILAILTAIEFCLFYLEQWHVISRPVAVTLLVSLSAWKFVLVIQWFMHLKFDSKIFTGVFAFPAALGTLVIVALIILYQWLPTMPV